MPSSDATATGARSTKRSGPTLAFVAVQGRPDGDPYIPPPSDPCGVHGRPTRRYAQRPWRTPGRKRPGGGLPGELAELRRLCCSPRAWPLPATKCSWSAPASAGSHAPPARLRVATEVVEDGDPEAIRLPDDIRVSTFEAGQMATAGATPRRPQRAVV